MTNKAGMMFRPPPLHQDRRTAAYFARMYRHVRTCVRTRNCMPACANTGNRPYMNSHTCQYACVHQAVQRRANLHTSCIHLPLCLLLADPFLFWKPTSATLGAEGLWPPAVRQDRLRPSDSEALLSFLTARAQSRSRGSLELERKLLGDPFEGHPT